MGAVRATGLYRVVQSHTDWRALVGCWTNGRQPSRLDGRVGPDVWVRQSSQDSVVLAQSKQRLRITGRLLNGSATAQFRHGSGPLTRDLVVEDLARSSVVPGGATPEMLREYAFIMSHVFYPVPGCWEFTVAIGDAKHTIVRTIGTSTPP